jgi:hypothetical protein
MTSNGQIAQLRGHWALFVNSVCGKRLRETRDSIGTVGMRALAAKSRAIADNKTTATPVARVFLARI